MKFFRSSACSVLFAILLCVSLYFNFKPEEPLLSFTVYSPSSGGYLVEFSYDSVESPNEVMNTLSVLENASTVTEAISLDFENPPIVLYRNVPSYHYVARIYNIYFVEDVTYIWYGSTYGEYGNHEVRKLDARQTVYLKELIYGIEE